MTQFLSIQCGLAAIRSRGLRAALVALVTATLAVATTAHAVTIDWATVRNPGNVNDTINTGTNPNYGAVGYEYRIGKYEITIGQYTEFLNSVAKSDPYGLYNTGMAAVLNVAGISRSGSSGAYSYGIISPSGVTPAGADSPSDRPITNASWFDAARFANWMHNGQGNGSTETGAYTLNGATSGNAPTRNPGATFYIPTENEWYKAAYYSPVLNSGTGGYYKYATQSNSAPGNTIGGGSNQANYYTGAGYSVPQSSSSSNQNLLTNVGAFSNSTSYYGTFDQSGNVLEWNDLAGTEGTSRAVRGGNFLFSASFISSSLRISYSPSFEAFDIGFRLASPVTAPIPEIDPAGLGSVLALVAGSLGLLERRRRPGC